ncbi:hypothetical protein [Amycolatopsis sp.]|uniref:hypothetical protein n=1 Tax=Amycolatopsis sp. TaxID=37632 RepID=UPI002BD3232B|nr:hypothetical protein [Amycolatopsis sp.]HVV11617.1 hypothetical protein [Amycolatopsis sp.]
MSAQQKILNAGLVIQAALKDIADGLLALDESAPVVNAGRTNQKRLTQREAGRIRELHATGEWTQKALAEAFDINPATVSRIVRGIYWK